MTEHGEYTEVVERTADQRDASSYHVRREPRPEGGERLHWVLLGRVEPDEGEEARRGRRTGRTGGDA